MKQFYPLLLLMLLVVSCSKSDSVDPITERSSYLVSNTSSIGKWKLTSLKSGTTNLALTATQSGYVKRYTTDNKFSDTDGLIGTWSMPTADQLVEVFTNFSSGVSVTQVYKINSITAAQLNLTYTVNGTELTANYTATN
jgi:hypothetical protein